MRGSAAFRASVAPGGVLAGPWVRNDLWRRARAVPSLDLRFADNKSLTDAVTGESLVTFTRASTGTYVGSDGLIKTAATNEARFDHNPSTGESLGLLVEEQRTNLLLRSEEFETTWSALNVTVSSNTTISPAGSQTADKITPAASNAAHLISQSATVTASTAYIASVYVKGDGAPFVQVAYDNGSSVGAFVNVDLSNGAITRGPLASGGATNIVGSVASAGNGFYRISVGATHTGTAGRMLISVLPSGQSLAGMNPSTTTAATDKIIVWGAQLEAGAFPTSYIPTTTAAVTRSADVASITGANFSSWYRQDEGTVFTEYTGVIAGVNRGVWALTADSSNANNIIDFFNGGVSPVLRVNSSGVNQAYIFTGTATTATFNKVASAFAQNNFARSLNGLAADLDTSGTMPATTPILLNIGTINAYGVASLSGTIRRLTYWPQRLSNSTLQSITI